MYFVTFKDSNMLCLLWSELMYNALDFQLKLLEDNDLDPSSLNEVMTRPIIESPAMPY